MSTPIIMHINYCEQGQTLEEACRNAVSWGFDGIEFRQFPKQGDVSDLAQYYDTVARVTERSKLPHVLFGGPPTNILAQDPGAREEAIQLQERCFRLAAERFDLVVWNVRTQKLRRKTGEQVVTGSKAATDEEWAWATEAFKHLARVAQELGFRMAMETHHHNLTDLPSVVMSLVSRIGHPAVGVTLDYGNVMTLKDADPLEKSIRDIGDRLYYIHLKNAIALPGGHGTVRVGLGDGQINNREFLRLAKEVGYAGPVCIESPRPGDREWFARQDLSYIRSVVEALNL